MEDVSILSKSSAEDKLFVVCWVGFSCCFLWDHMEAVGFLCKYSDQTYIYCLCHTNTQNVQRRSQESYAVEQRLSIEFTVTICCDSQLSQTFLSRANQSHVTKAQHYWEFIVLLAGATLCFNVLYFFNALLVQNEIHSQIEHYLK